MVSPAPRSMAFAEFTLPRAPASDRRSAQRWIASHVARHTWIVVRLLVGAVGNAALAAVVPLAIGQAFNLILPGDADAAGLARLALIILVSQVVRGLLQLGRNFGAQLVGPRLH